MGHGPWWYSGEIDLGFSGALRTAATVVADDPIFGLLAYGGDLKNKAGSIEVVPKDGLRARFRVLLRGARLQIELARDGFAKNMPVTFDPSLTQFKFLVENRSNDEHDTVLHLHGLPAGVYQVTIAGRSMPTVNSQHGEPHDVTLPIRSTTVPVTISRKQERKAQ
jgi:hypothetical protein